MLVSIDGKVIDLDRVTHIYECISVPALRTENRRDETWVFIEHAQEPIKFTPRKGALFLQEYYAYKGQPKEINTEEDNSIVMSRNEPTLPSNFPKLNMEKLKEGVASKLKAGL